MLKVPGDRATTYQRSLSGVVQDKTGSFTWQLAAARLWCSPSVSLTPYQGAQEGGLLGSAARPIVVPFAKAL